LKEDYPTKELITITLTLIPGELYGDGDKTLAGSYGGAALGLLLQPLSSAYRLVLIITITRVYLRVRV
jgi:hypothetical protein